jgi:outer membrane protein assembly factor BamA
MRPSVLPRRVPVTLAARVLHYGRYGPDSENGRLYPLYLGYGSLVRGYSFNSFANEAAYGAINDRLFGSRMALASAEIRLPLLGVPSFGLVSFPYLPTEFTLFADAGMAWGTIRQTILTSGGTSELGTPFDQQKPIFSVGSSLRMNVLGAIILEPYVAFPLSRFSEIDLDTQEKRGVFSVFGLNLTPGW